MNHSIALLLFMTAALLIRSLSYLYRAKESRKYKDLAKFANFLLAIVATLIAIVFLLVLHIKQ